MKIYLFIIFCLFFTKISEVFGHSAVCDYYDKVFYAHIIKIYSYSCKIEINNLHNINTIAEIYGYHEDDRDDSNVNYLEIASENTKIQEFSSVFCSKFPNLQGLEVKKLKIASIDDDSLQICLNLQLLQFTENEVLNLPENLLSENLELLEFVFTSNKIVTIPEDAFEMQENLKQLNLEKNKIKDLPPGVFKALLNLEKLNLNMNKIEELNPNWFKKLKNLLKLSINYNKIQNLPRKVFGYLDNLMILELEGNQLVEIHSSSFGNRARLQAVILNHNYVRLIDPEFIIQSSIGMLHMEKNLCFARSINHRSSLMDPNLQRCFRNYRLTTTTRTTTEMPTTTTTTTEPSTTSTFTAYDLTATEIMSNFQEPYEYIDDASISTEITKATTFKTTTSPEKSTQLCGKAEDRIPAVQKGSNVIRGQFPWNVAIFRTDGTERYVCSGVLVSNRKIVTGGKFMYKIERGKFTKMLNRDIVVILGGHNISQNFESSRIHLVVTAIHIHKEFKFKSSNIDADIAVIVLEKAVNYGEFIKPICLTTSDDGPLSIDASVLVGYGYDTSLNKSQQLIPKKFDIQIQNEFECLISNDAAVDILSNRSFCAGSYVGRNDCFEDYGSGLYVKYIDIFYLRGILSKLPTDDDGRCLPDSFDFYTDVTKFVGWIEELPFNNYDYDDVELRTGPIWN